MAIDVRAGALVLHHGQSQWIVTHGVVSASRVLWSPLGRKNGWACSGFSCEVRGKLRKQGVEEDVL